MHKPLKPTYIMNEIHEYEFKSLSKTHEFNPGLSKTIFSIILSQKKKKKHILYQNQGTFNLG